MKYLEHCHEIDHSKETKSKVRGPKPANDLIQVIFWMVTVCNHQDLARVYEQNAIQRAKI